MIRSALSSLLMISALVAQETPPPPESAAPDAAAETQDDAMGWPRAITSGDYEITLYQPQVDSFSGKEILGRAAVMVQKGQEEPVFGAVWLKATVQVDQDERLVHLEKVQVPEVRMPEANDQQQAGLGKLIEERVLEWSPTVSLDRILTAIEDEDGQASGAKGIRSQIPTVKISKKPALLVFVDGEPVVQKMRRPGFSLVSNCPLMLVQDDASKEFWLLYGNEWFTTTKLDGRWLHKRPAPDKVRALEAELQGVSTPDGASQLEVIPEIIGSLEPAELLAFDGEPKFVPIKGTDLLLAENCQTELLRHIEEKSYFALFAGRWFKNAALESDGWTAVDELPDDFSQIPADGDIASVRAHIPGTEEAREAALEAQIPQTAVISKDATITVTYEGDPEFEPLPGSSVQYAVNTAFDVIMIKPDLFYCCYEGVWYRASSPAGPWAVADEVPETIYEQKAESPLYHTTYVRYHGPYDGGYYYAYYPGYTGSYIWHGRVVYGTGWYYHSRWRRWYYPRPVTYGVAVRYNPVTGRWGARVGIGYRNAGASVGVVSRRSGWWGPAGYHASTQRVRVNAGGAAVVSSRSYSRNIYTKSTNRGKTLAVNTGKGLQPTSMSRKASAVQSRVATGRSNNVFVDKSGNVYRRTKEGAWQQRENRNWSSADRAAAKQAAKDLKANRPQKSTASQRLSTEQRKRLERQFQNRQRGNARYQNYNNYRTRHYGGAARGGAPRGGVRIQGPRR